MILIADSGSTKCEWVLLNQDFELSKEIKTMGINPYFHSASLITSMLKGSNSFSPILSQVKEIFFYGVGCYTKMNRKVIETALKNTFPMAQVTVEHELSACANACYDGSPIIGCILGTGSNSVFYDGEKMESAHPSLGYILGDIGSGCYFGKQLLRAYYYKQLPNHLVKGFEERFGLELNVMLHSVYDDEQANVYLASFMTFVTDNAKDPYFEEMTNLGFKKFIEQQICAYPNHKEVPVHFVGAVAYFFQDNIKKIAAEYGIQTGYFLRKPISNLIKYHQRFGKELVEA